MVRATRAFYGRGPPLRPWLLGCAPSPLPLLDWWGWRYSESSGVSAHSCAMWPGWRQVAHLCQKVHEPGYAHLPLFHDTQILSNVSGRGQMACRRRCLPSDWGSLGPGIGVVLDMGRGSLMLLRAHSSQLWSTSRQNWQNAILSVREPRNVEATRLGSRLIVPW